MNPDASGGPHRQARQAVSPAGTCRGRTPWSEAAFRSAPTRVRAAGHGLVALREPVAAAACGPGRRRGGRAGQQRPAAAPWQPGTVVVAVSASGGSVETVDAVSRYEGACPIVALTNTEGALTSPAAHTVSHAADEERGGVACRSFQHTLAALLALESRLARDRRCPRSRRRPRRRRPLASARDWRPRVADQRAIGPDGTHVVAPPAGCILGLPVGADASRDTAHCPPSAARPATGATSTSTSRGPPTTGWCCSPARAGSPSCCPGWTERGSTVVAIGGEVAWCSRRSCATRATTTMTCGCSPRSSSPSCSPPPSGARGVGETGQRDQAATMRSRPAAFAS